MAEWYSIVKMYHIFFTHSSIHEHLGYFHVPAVVKSAIINIRVYAQTFFKMQPSSDYLNYFSLKVWIN